MVMGLWLLLYSYMQQTHPATLEALICTASVVVLHSCQHGYSQHHQPPLTPPLQYDYYDSNYIQIQQWLVSQLAVIQLLLQVVQEATTTATTATPSSTMMEEETAVLQQTHTLLSRRPILLVLFTQLSFQIQDLLLLLSQLLFADTCPVLKYHYQYYTTTSNHKHYIRAIATSSTRQLLPAASCHTAILLFVSHRYSC